MRKELCETVKTDITPGNEELSGGNSFSNRYTRCAIHHRMKILNGLFEKFLIDFFRARFKRLTSIICCAYIFSSRFNMNYFHNQAAN